MSTPKSLSRRQQYWCRHLERCAGSGLTLAAYAEQHGLEVGSLYTAKARLRRLGAWPPAGPRFVRVKTAPVTVPSMPAVPVLCRVTLPNGVTVETAGGDLAAVLFAAARLP